MTPEDKAFLDRLKKLTKQYDVYYEKWPENKYEGESVYAFCEEVIIKNNE